MAKKESGSLDRRKFLTITTGGLGCLAFGGIREALAAAAETGKPILTDKGLTELVMETAANPKLYQKYAQMAKGDLFKFLDAHFTMTKAQSYAVRNMSSANLKTLNGAIDYSTKAVSAGSSAPMVVGFEGKPTEGNKGTARITGELHETSSPGGSTSRGGSVTVEVSY